VENPVWSRWHCPAPKRAVRTSMSEIPERRLAFACLVRSLLGALRFPCSDRATGQVMFWSNRCVDCSISDPKKKGSTSRSKIRPARPKLFFRMIKRRRQRSTENGLCGCSLPLKISLIGFARRKTYNSLPAGYPQRITGALAQAAALRLKKGCGQLSVLKLQRFRSVVSPYGDVRVLFGARPRRTGPALAGRGHLGIRPT